MSKKLDTQSIGLDVGLSFVKWLTGAENLHYGLWDGLDVRAENLGTAQSAYTDKLFELLPAEPCRILDIGGGAGETAKKLIALGHQVDIVIPAPFLADRCRANAPTATVHEMPFEDFEKSSSLLRATLGQSKIKTIGIVAYGKDYSADVSVKRLEFY